MSRMEGRFSFSPIVLSFHQLLFPVCSSWHHPGMCGGDSPEGSKPRKGTVPNSYSAVACWLHSLVLTGQGKKGRMYHLSPFPCPSKSVLHTSAFPVCILSSVAPLKGKVQKVWKILSWVFFLPTPLGYCPSQGTSVQFLGNFIPRSLAHNVHRGCVWWEGQHAWWQQSRQQGDVAWVVPQFLYASAYRNSRSICSEWCVSM